MKWADVDLENGWWSIPGAVAKNGQPHRVPLNKAVVDILKPRLAAAGEGALFVWEGVIGYVDDAAIDQSLRFMAGAGGAGSRVVFTFAQIGFESDTATDRTRRAGFRSCEEIAGDDLWRLYQPGEPHPNAWVTRIATAIV